MIRLTLSLLAFLLFNQQLLAQQAAVSGKVTTNGKAVEFVNIGVKGTVIGSVTDESGKYKLKNLSAGKYELIVSSVGYETQKKEVVLLSGESKIINFDLKEVVGALEEVVITATMKEVSKLESAVPVEVYSKVFFKSNPTPSIFESLQNVNGVRPQLNCNICNTGDIHINGLEGPYTMVLLDGMPIVSGLSTVYGLTGIPQSLIERIEVVKGPASTLYGSEAVGGLINIITKQPSSAPLLSADIFATGWGEVNAELGLKYRIGNKVKALMGVNYFNYQNPIDNNDDGFTDLTLQDRISVFNKISFQRKSNKVFSLAGRYVYEDRWGGEMHWTRKYRGGDEVYGESIFTKRWEAIGVYQLPVAESVKLQVSANGHSQNSVYGDSPYLADQYIGFGQLTWNKILGNHDLLLGAAYRYTFYDDNTPATFDSNQDENAPSSMRLPGLFIQDEIVVDESNKLLLGMRYDYNSIHGGIFTPRINYKWNSLNKRNIFRASVGNGYRVANVFTEDHAALTGARDVVFEGELQPETSWNANLNFVKKIYTKKGTYIGLDASAFYTHFTNRILPDYETDPNKIIYGNLNGYSVSKGVSLNADVSWENGLKVLAGITVMDVTVSEDGERFRQLLTESVQGVWNIGYTIQRLGLTIDYTGNLYGPMRLPILGELDDRASHSPWWSIQNIQFTKQIGDRWEIYGGVKNLLNFTPADNSIARAFDPFDRDVVFGNDGQAIASPENPNALTFDPTYVYAANQGIRGFAGLRFTLQH